MIVQSIAVSNWRNILRDLYIGPFLEGLNVVHAPNGSGKSSLFEALRRGLMDRHDVKGSDIEEIQPWGKELTPTVTVEFKHKGQSYQITKQFIQSPKAALDINRKGRYERLADGRNAVEKLQELLTKNPPSKGLSRVEHWGWAQALWAPQGSLALGSLSNDVLSDIRELLNAQLGATGSSRVEDEIRHLYGQYFTGKGSLKKGVTAPRSVRLREQLREANELLLQAKTGYQDFESTSADVAEFRRERFRAEQELASTKVLLDSKRQEAKSYRLLKSETDSNRSEAEIEGGKFRELDSLIKQIDSEEGKYLEESALLQSMLAELKTETEKLADAQEHLESCEENAKKIKELEAEVEKKKNDAEAARVFTDISSKLSDLGESIALISRAREAIRIYESRKQTINAPDEKTLSDIIKAIGDCERISFKIESSLMNIEVMAETGLTLDVLKGDSPGSVRLDPGSKEVFKGSPQVSFRIPDVATIRAWGPTGSVEELRRDLEETEKSILKMTEPYGTADPAILDGLCAEVRQIDHEMGNERMTINALLRKADEAELEASKAALEKQRDEILKIHAEWAANQPEGERLKVEAESAARSIEKQKEESSKKIEDARSDRDQLNTAVEVRQANIISTKRAIKEITDRLLNHKKDNRTPEQRKRDLDEISINWKAARAKLEKAENLLKQFADDPEEVADRLENDKKDLENQRNKCKENEDIETGRLRNLSERGSYSALVDAEEKISQLERKIKRAELEQDSIKLLHATMEAVRKEALSFVAKPVEDEATRTLSYICGANLAKICLGNNFEPSQVIPESFNSEVELVNLSGGEREQLYFAVRLALADVLAQNERQLVVLDDVLTATDSLRLGRVLDVLEESAKKLQIIGTNVSPGAISTVSFGQVF